MKHGINHLTEQLNVIKRDGREVTFNPDKIHNAIYRAFEDVEGELDNVQKEQITQLTYAVLQEIGQRFAKDVQIYEIQSVVEHLLVEEGYDVVAKAYTDYRLARDIERAKAMDIQHRIDELQAQEQTIINENANKDSRVFNTQRDLTAGAVAKSIGLKMLPEHVANAHQKGQIHYHDLDYHPYTPLTNCCLIDFKSMFEQGFQIGNAEVESPKSIQTATAQMAQIIANVASSQYGGCSANRIDEILAPFAERNLEKHRKIAQQWIEGESKQEAYALERTKKDIYDAMQSLEYEINTLYTSQGQTPFTTLGFGLGTSWISREIQRAILQVRMNGLGLEKRTAIFPKLVFTLKRGVNLETTDPNYDLKQLAIECATKRMYPDVLMYDKIVELTGSFKVPMGCRSFLQGWHDENDNEVNDGRMNLGVVTLNLPRIALESKGNISYFWHLLEERLSIIKDAMVYRIQRVKEAVPENAPILYQHGAFGKRLHSEDAVDECFRNKRATISLGYIGLYEVATVFYGPD